MSKLEEKIKALMTDDEADLGAKMYGGYYREGMYEARSIIARRYAENYRVTWEQFVEHCKQEYSYTIEFRRSADLEYILLHNDGVRFYEGGTVRINALYPIAAKTLILWGRYLEGLEDE